MSLGKAVAVVDELANLARFHRAALKIIRIVKKDPQASILDLAFLPEVQNFRANFISEGKIDNLQFSVSLMLEVARETNRGKALLEALENGTTMVDQEREQQRLLIQEQFGDDIESLFESRD